MSSLPCCSCRFDNFNTTYFKQEANIYCLENFHSMFDWMEETFNLKNYLLPVGIE